MSDNLKRNLSEEIEVDSGEELSLKRAKMEQIKTPISILYEMCTKEKEKPKFTELQLDSPEIPDYLKSSEKRFWTKCEALKKSTIAGGVTKKAAQHAAAQQILHKAEMGDSDESDDDDVQSVFKGDAVTDLLNLCVQKNYHKPQLNCIDSYGPSHDPLFTFECRLDSILRTATAKTKNESKQMAAKKVLDIMLSSFPNMEKKVSIVNEANLVKEETRKKITTYLKLKELGKVDTMGTTLADRSDFFINHPNEDFINALKTILMKKIDTDLKYEELKKELETMWECKVGDYFETSDGSPRLKQFECLVDFDQFTVYLVAANEKLLKKEVVTYFSEMLEVPCK